MDIAQAIREKAESLGFTACGFSPAARIDALEAPLLEWLESGRAAEMHYMARNTDIRLDPRKLLDGAQTVISLAAGYYYPLDDREERFPGISRYALGQDYHVVLKDRGHELLSWMNTEFGPVRGRVFTDSAPLLEREWARRAGLGWIGRNGCLLLPGQGSWYFLAEIVTDLEISSPNPIVPDRCGTCTRCVDACPTGALEGDGRMDPRKCISYLTIEHRGEIPETFRGQWHDWIFGCDICQEVCPWNRKPESTPIAELRPVPGRPSILGDALRNREAVAIRQAIQGSPLERAGWKGILRNFAFLGNTDSVE